MNTFLTPARALAHRAITGAVLLLGFFLLIASTTMAATLTVTNNNDAGGGSLRQAILDANASGGADSITFAANVTGTITLTTGQLTISEALTITGPGASVLAISGNNASRVFRITSGVVAITGLTIKNANSNDGGGIFNNGILTVKQCVLTDNTAGGNGGGGIANANQLTVDQCTFSNNHVSFYGGGLLQIDGGTSVVTNSAFYGNSGQFGAGAGNQGISRHGEMTFINCTFSDNEVTKRGGALGNYGTGSSSTLTLISCTIANNKAVTGGGIDNGFNAVGPTIVNLKNTILANNTGSNVTGYAGAQYISQGYNISSDGTGNLVGPNDQPNTNPLLGALANNGGPTLTHALLAGSPALDNGMNSGSPTDQRGFARTVDSQAIANAAGGDGTDIGAFEFGSAPLLDVQAADPAICLDPGGLVGVTATVTNPNPFPAVSNFIATLPVGLTGVTGTCVADVNPNGCAIAPNGGTVTWDGTLNPGQTVTIIYRARIAPNVVQGAQLTINNTANVGGATANFNAVLNVICPTILNTRVTDQKSGSVLVFPYYTSSIGGANDTRMTISNISNAGGTAANQTYVHLFFIDGTTCQQADFFLCLTPNASFSFKASEYDPGNTGYVLAVAVDNQGVPVRNNVLIGNAFVRTTDFADNYSAENFWANSTAVATVDGNRATLYFDQVGYDAVPKQFAVEIQSPVDVVGQQIVTAGLSGDLTTSVMSGAGQVGTGLAFNEKEAFGSFNLWLTGACQARGTIATNSPRVPNGLGNLIKTGQAGTLKFNVGGAVGLLMTPRTAMWHGIRTLHKTQTTATTITIPVIVPVC